RGKAGEIGKKNCHLPPLVGGKRAGGSDRRRCVVGFLRRLGRGRAGFAAAPAEGLVRRIVEAAAGAAPSQLCAATGAEPTSFAILLSTARAAHGVHLR